MSSLLCILPCSDANVARWPKFCPKKQAGQQKISVLEEFKAEFYFKMKKRDEENFKKKFLSFLDVYWPENNFGTWQHCPPFPPAAWYLQSTPPPPHPLVAALELLLYFFGRGGSINILSPKKTLKTSFLKKYVNFKKIPDAVL